MTQTKSRRGCAIVTLPALAAYACGGDPTFDTQTNRSHQPLQEAASALPPHVVLEEKTTSSDGEIVDVTQHRDTDSEYWARVALDLEPGDDTQRAWIESDQYERGGQDGVGNHFVSGFRVLRAERRTLDADQLFEYVDALRLAGDIDGPLYEDVMQRLMGQSGLPVAASERISNLASRQLAALSQDEDIDVALCTRQLPPARLPETAMLNEIVNGFDREAARAALEGPRATRQMRADQAQESLRMLFPLGAAVEGAGDLPCVVGRLTKSQIEAVQTRSEVEKIYVGVEVEGSGDNEGDGTTMRQGTQAEAFRLANDSGGATPSKSNGFSRLTAAVIDQGFADKHLAFRDNSSTATRVLDQWNCVNSPCTQTTDLPGNSDNDNHGTLVTGVLAGELLDAQDPAFTTSTDRASRTGVAGEAGIVLLKGIGPTSMRRAVQKAQSLDVDVAIRSGATDNDVCSGFDSTQNNFTTDGLCRGESTLLKDAINSAYSDGVFFVKAAGNDGPSTSTCPCTVTVPGDAEGSFTVGALNDSCANRDHAVTRSQIIADYSAEGGGELGGFTATSRERTLIGLVAPSEHDVQPTCTPGTGGTCDTNGLSQYYCTNIGTSFSAPVVAGAAIAYKDMWITEGLSPTTWLDDAGNMRAQMLLMGDRVANDGSTRRTTGFSTKYGAGRLKMRHRSPEGMDDPWLSRSGWVTISDGEVFQRFVSADTTAIPLSSDVDRIVAVAWWFEPNTVTLAAYITFQVQMFQSDCATHVSTVTDASADTRKRVFRSDISGGRCLRLQITGVDVPAGETRRVYWAYYFEDADRDDLNGPTLYSPIQPWDVELP